MQYGVTSDMAKVSANFIRRIFKGMSPIYRSPAEVFKRCGEREWPSHCREVIDSVRIAASQKSLCQDRGLLLTKLFGALADQQLSAKSVDDVWVSVGIASLGECAATLWSGSYRIADTAEAVNWRRWLDCLEANVDKLKVSSFDKATYTNAMANGWFKAACRLSDTPDTALAFRIAAIADLAYFVALPYTIGMPDKTARTASNPLCRLVIDREVPAGLGIAPEKIKAWLLGTRFELHEILHQPPELDTRQGKDLVVDVNTSPCFYFAQCIIEQTIRPIVPASSTMAQRFENRLMPITMALLNLRTIIEASHYVSPSRLLLTLAHRQKLSDIKSQLVAEHIIRNTDSALCTRVLPSFSKLINSIAQAIDEAKKHPQKKYITNVHLLQDMAKAEGAVKNLYDQVPVWEVPQQITSAIVRALEFLLQDCANCFRTF